MVRLNSDHYRVLLAAAVASSATKEGVISRERLLDQLALRPHADVDEALGLLARLGLIVDDEGKWLMTQRGWDVIDRANG